METRSPVRFETQASPRARAKAKVDFESSQSSMERHHHQQTTVAAASGLDFGAESEPLKSVMSTPRSQPQCQWGRMHSLGMVVGASMAAYAIMSNLRLAEQEHFELFHIYYQPLLVMLAMLWMWSMDVRAFEQRRIAYSVCFSLQDQQYLLSSQQLFQVAATLSGIVLGSAALFAYHCANGQTWLAGLHPPMMYGLLILLLLPLPLRFLFPGNRHFFAKTLFRVATPIREVTWSDFLLADVLTSLAKALSDSERAMCHMMAGPVMKPHASEQLCGSSSWIIPLGLAMPYLWRLFQCIRVYKDTGNQGQVFNAIKYSTAFPVIIFSAMKYQVTAEAWLGIYKPLWLGAALLNSSYSYFWDIERDWEIQFFTSPGERRCGLPQPVFRSELFFDRAFYYYLMVSNLILRLAWTYKLSPHLRRNHDTVLAFTLLEAFRRFQWVPVRVEVELRKLQHQKPELGQLVPAPSMDKLAKGGEKKSLLTEDNP